MPKNNAQVPYNRVPHCVALRLELDLTVFSSPSPYRLIGRLGHIKSENSAKVSYNTVIQCVALRTGLDLTVLRGMGWYRLIDTILMSSQNTKSEGWRTIVRDCGLTVALRTNPNGQLPLYFARVVLNTGGAIRKLSKQLWSLFYRVIKQFKQCQNISTAPTEREHSLKQGDEKMAAFHDDPKMLALVQDILGQGKITQAIETGTYHGDSTEALAKTESVQRVTTIEIREDYYLYAKSKLSIYPKVQCLYGPSQNLLEPVLAQALSEGPTLVFLDAHWQDNWPLQKELEIILQVKAKALFPCVVIVDDFEVPGRPNLYGTQGGGGTIGSPDYGPRLKENHTPCSMKTFWVLLQDFKQIWFPNYSEKAPGYAIASDIHLDLSRKEAFLYVR